MSDLALLEHVLTMPVMLVPMALHPGLYAGRMLCVGVARRGDADELRAGGAVIVFDRLDRLQPAELLGRLERRP